MTVPDIRAGDLYEDCRNHPMLCIDLKDGDELVGISLIDGEQGSCSLGDCGVEKLELGDAVAIRARLRPPAPSLPGLPPHQRDTRLGLSRVPAVSTVRTPTSRIGDWESFHDVFAEALRFPDYYGRNNNAFIDLLRHPDTPDVGIDLKPGDTLVVSLDEPGAHFAKRCPEQHQFLVDTLALVNAEGLTEGEWVAVALAYPAGPDPA